MKKEYVVLSSISFGVGFITAFIYNKFKNKKAESLKKSEDGIAEVYIKKDNEESSNGISESAKVVTTCADRIKDLQYKEDSDEESITEEESEELENYIHEEALEQEKNTSKGTIIPLSREKWEAHLYGAEDTDYDAEDLYFFVKEYVLTDEFGKILSPEAEYVGTVLDKFNFKNDDNDEIYVRNHDHQVDYAVHKVKNISRDDYFDDGITTNE